MLRVVAVLACVAMRWLVIWATCCIAHIAHAQALVQELGGGIGLQGVTYMLHDTPNDRMLLTGSFAYANDVSVSPGILSWNTQEFESLGCGVEWDCVTPGSQGGLANPTRSVVVWNGQVYLAGDISFSRDGVAYNGVMRWDGFNWLSLGAGVDGRVKSIKVIDDELIVAGWFEYADTVLARGLAKWDGEAWHRVEDVPPFYIGGGPNLINDVEKFQGEWYIGGNLPLGRDLVKWNGAEWEIVGGGFTSGLSQVNRLAVHDDRLYVAGSFARCPPLGNGADPGNGILAWDGSQWDDLGGGTCGANNGAVISMMWWGADLYVTGLFNRIGGADGQSLARWDGMQWCNLAPPNYWGTGGPNALAVYHDSLIIGGAFLDAGGEDVSCFGKWIGGDYTYSCGTINSIEEPAPFEGMTVFPNPCYDRLWIKAPRSGAHLVRVVDAMGRTVLEAPASSAYVDVGSLAPGFYSTVMLDTSQRMLAVTRFMKY